MAFLKHSKAAGGQNKQGNVLMTTSVRDFGGGLNVTDTDLDMKPRYSKALDNLERALDGTLTLRSGTKLLTTLNSGSDTSDIINIYYFNNFAITVQASGQVSKVAGDGVVTSMSTVWTATTFVSFTVFNSQLLIYNGVNKPLVIEGNFNKPNYMVCLYSVDAARQHTRWFDGHKPCAIHCCCRHYSSP